MIGFLKPKSIVETITEIGKGRYIQIILMIDTLHNFFETGIDAFVANTKEQMEDQVIQLMKVINNTLDLDKESIEDKF